jgi:hypothetical protein
MANETVEDMMGNLKSGPWLWKMWVASNAEELKIIKNDGVFRARTALKKYARIEKMKIRHSLN